MHCSVRFHGKIYYCSAFISNYVIFSVLVVTHLVQSRKTMSLSSIISLIFSRLRSVNRLLVWKLKGENVRDGAKFMGYPGRVLKGGDKDFFYEKI